VVSTLLPLKVQGAEASFRGTRLIGPIDLEVDGAGMLVLVGPNGSGKTTLLRLLHGAARLSKGTVNWACSDEVARSQQSFVFQRPIMLRRSVRDNLIYPLRVRGVARAEAQATAERWADALDLTAALDAPAPRLSGGEQQKLAVARALITSPRVLFLDEPSASLDARSTRAVETMLTEAKDRGTRIILSTHDMGQARRLADDVAFMLNGRIQETGPAKAFFAKPETEAAQAFLRGDLVE